MTRLWYGDSVDEYLSDYPHLTREDVVNCIRYCARQQCIEDDVHSFCEQCSLDKRPADDDLAQRYDKFYANHQKDDEERVRDVWMLARELG